MKVSPASLRRRRGGRSRRESRSRMNGIGAARGGRGEELLDHEIALAASAGPIATAWSASRTCAPPRRPQVTATLATPIARHVRMMRTAISPRLAISTLRTAGIGGAGMYHARPGRTGGAGRAEMRQLTDVRGGSVGVAARRARDRLHGPAAVRRRRSGCRVRRAAAAPIEAPRQPRTTVGVRQRAPRRAARSRSPLFRRMSLSPYVASSTRRWTSRVAPGPGRRPAGPATRGLRRGPSRRRARRRSRRGRGRRALCRRRSGSASGRRSRRRSWPASTACCRTSRRRRRSRCRRGPARRRRHRCRARSGRSCAGRRGPPATSPRRRASARRARRARRSPRSEQEGLSLWSPSRRAARKRCRAARRCFGACEVEVQEERRRTRQADRRVDRRRARARRAEDRRQPARVGKQCPRVIIGCGSSGAAYRCSRPRRAARPRSLRCRFPGGTP